MGWLFGDSAQDQMKLLQPQLNRQKADQDEYIDMIRGLVEGSGFNFFGPKTTTSNSTGSSSTTQKIDQFVRPEVLPEYKKLEGMWKGIIEGRLARPTALPPGSVERQVAAINTSYSGADAAARNAAASRGLSGPQAIALQEPLQSDRAGKIADLVASIPSQERAFQNEDVELATAIAQIFGTGQRTTGTTTSNTTSRQAGSVTNPADISQYLGYLGLLKPYQSPILQPSAQQGSIGPIITGAIAAIIA